MRKVVLADLGKIEFQEVPLPEVKTGWVRVKILRNGLCGTDVHNYYKETIFGKDRYPFNMGHECCGIVDAIGDEVKKGDMVAKAAEGAPSACIHAAYDGVVDRVDKNKIVILCK